MKVHECEQGSGEWLQLRAGIPTASEFGNLLTPKFEIRKGETPRTYLATKLAEMWIGGPLMGFNSWATDQGKLREPKAIDWFALETGKDIQRVGFITTDDARVGCSPDGLIGEDEGIEIKCPEPVAHVKYLLNGELPDEYAAQVYGSMYVTGFSQWKFLSYRRGFPAVLLTIMRDESIMQKIEAALVKFLDDFDEGMKALTVANGGPPPKKKVVKEASWITEPVENIQPVSA